MIASSLCCLTVEGTISRIANILDKADTGLWQLSDTLALVLKQLHSHFGNWTIACQLTVSESPVQQFRLAAVTLLCCRLQSGNAEAVPHGPCWNMPHLPDQWEWWGNSSDSDFGTKASAYPGIKARIAGLDPDTLSCWKKVSSSRVVGAGAWTVNFWLLGDGCTFCSVANHLSSCFSWFSMKWSLCHPLPGSQPYWHLKASANRLCSGSLWQNSVSSQQLQWQTVMRRHDCMIRQDLPCSCSGQQWSSVMTHGRLGVSPNRKEWLTWKDIDVLINIIQCTWHVSN